MKLLILVACFAAAYGDCVATDRCGSSDTNKADYTAIANCVASAGAATADGQTADLTCADGWTRDGADATKRVKCSTNKWTKNGAGVFVCRKTTCAKAASTGTGCKTCIGGDAWATTWTYDNNCATCWGGYKKTTGQAGNCEKYVCSPNTTPGTGCKACGSWADTWTYDDKCSQCHPGYIQNDGAKGCKKYAVATPGTGASDCKTATAWSTSTTKDNQCDSCNFGYEAPAGNVCVGTPLADFCTDPGTTAIAATGNIAAYSTAINTGDAKRKVSGSVTASCKSGYKNAGSGAPTFTCSATGATDGNAGSGKWVKSNDCVAYTVLTDTGAGVKCKTATTTPNAEKDLQCAACNNGYELQNKLTCALKDAYCATGNIAASTGYKKLDGAAAKKLNEFNSVDCAAGYGGTGKLTCTANTDVAGTFAPSGCTAITCDGTKWTAAAATAPYAFKQLTTGSAKSRECKTDTKKWADKDAVDGTTATLAQLKAATLKTGNAITQLVCATPLTLGKGAPTAMCTTTTTAGDTVSVTGCTTSDTCTKKTTTTAYDVPNTETDSASGATVTYACKQATHYGEASFSCANGIWTTKSSCMPLSTTGQWQTKACPVNACGVTASDAADVKCMKAKKSADGKKQEWEDGADSDCSATKPAAGFCKAGGADDDACKNAARCTKDTTGNPFKGHVCGLDETATAAALDREADDKKWKAGEKITQACKAGNTGGIVYTCTESYNKAGTSSSWAFVKSGACAKATAAPTDAPTGGDSASSSISAFVALLSVIAYLA